MKDSYVPELRKMMDRPYDAKGEQRIRMKANMDNIYAMLHEFRNWNREWDISFTKNPDNVDEFAKRLSQRFMVSRR